MKIAVIGAGIAGLTFAIACQQAGHKVQVFEKARKLKNIGGGLLFWPHSRAYFQALGIEIDWSLFTTNIRQIATYGASGKQLFVDDYQAFNQHADGPIFPVQRSALQTYFRNKLHTDTLNLNFKCLQIIEDEHGATIYFENGEAHQADLVIGADGIYSTVRQILGSPQTAKVTPYDWWGGIVPYEASYGVAAQDVTVILSPQQFFITWPLSENRLMWYLARIHCQELCEANKDLELLKKLWADDVRIDAILHAPQTESFFHFPIKSLTPNPHWFSKKICLLGDAAHAAGPILGLGANQSIEDAYVLFNCLQQYDIAEAMQRYRDICFPRNALFYEFERQSSEMLISRDSESFALLQQTLENITMVELYGDLFPFINADARACLKREILQGSTIT